MKPIEPPIIPGEGFDADFSFQTVGLAEAGNKNKVVAHAVVHSVNAIVGTSYRIYSKNVTLKLRSTPSIARMCDRKPHRIYFRFSGTAKPNATVYRLSNL
jgi:hypothetical protein